ncbi:MAG: porin family protein [Prolixibacteraceae bacterium]
MNKILLTSLLLVFVLDTFSQGPFNIGIKFGANRSTMITNIDDVLNQNILKEDVNNYLAGAFVRVNLGRLYLQPEAYFNTKGGIITPVGENQFSVPKKTTFNYQTIDVPALVGIKIIDKELINVRLHGGPVFSFVTANSLVSEISDFNADDLSKQYAGWQLGAGIDIWFVTLDARVENSFIISDKSSNYDIKNRVYLISAGIKLF